MTDFDKVTIYFNFIGNIIASFKNVIEHQEKLQYEKKKEEAKIAEQKIYNLMPQTINDLDKFGRTFLNGDNFLMVARITVRHHRGKFRNKRAA